MKAKKLIVVLLCVVMTFSLVLAACDQNGGKHVCESECPICLLCTNPDCREDVCRRKCHGHDSTSEPEDPNHQHTFNENEWAFDSTYHWHPATCTHTEEKGSPETHTLDADGFCSVCENQIFTLTGNWTVYSATGTVDDSMTMDSAPTAYDAGSLVIHYRRTTSKDYPHWGFWLWAIGTDGVRYPLNYQDEYGGVAVVALSKLGTETTRIGLIPINDNKTSGDDWYTKDTASQNRFFLPGVYKQSDGCYHLYLVEGDGNIYKTAQETNFESLNYGITAQFKDKQNIDINFATPVTHVALYENEQLIGEWSASGQKAGRVGYVLDSEAVIGNHYSVKATFEKGNKEVEGGVDIRAFYNLAEFAETYYYDGDDLGATLSGNTTTFKVWSPVSTKIVLNLYNQGDGGSAYETHDMTFGENGVWEYTVSERLAGKYYTYTVFNSKSPGGLEVVDPYAKSAGLNGERGMVVDFNSALVKPEGWDAISPQPYDANELVVWETHVADVTASNTWQPADPTHEKYRKTFLGMIETGTTYTYGGTTVTTGFDHIKELGVNAVQLIPVFDQSNEEEEEYRSFNWGYNPLNYNVLEGSYSTNPRDGYTRIMEFRQLVMAFNKIGVNIIMDVVYNHVNDAGSSNFEAIVPGYYFRYFADGTRSSGSGCGNDTMSERPMMRKFMIDSVCFLAETYKLGGFRFDIMGLHDVETMNLLTEAVRRINPNMILFGEAWDSNSSKTASSVELAGQKHAGDFADGLGQFNDRMRDQIFYFAAGKGCDNTRITDGLVGNTTDITDDPYKTVNYVTCHDGYTCADRFKLDTSVVTTSSSSHQKECSMLAQSVVLTSNGISFVLAGEEMLRSKFALGASGEQIHNSYNAPYEVNALDYSLKVKNKDMFDNYKKLIEFKKKFADEFGLDSKADIQDVTKYKANFSNNIFWIDIYATDGTHWVIAHAGPDATGTIALKTLYLSTTGNTSLTSVQPYETKIGTV